MQRIIRNRIRCRLCGDIIESYSVHDFKYCSCKSCAVDGGHAYLRRLCLPDRDDVIEELSVVEEVEPGQEPPWGRGLKDAAF